MKNAVQKFGKFLSSMVMPNIGAFIAWGFITALFIADGWLPNERLETLVGPILTYLLPILIAYQGGKIVGGDRGAVTGAIATVGIIVGADQAMLIGAMLMGPLSGYIIKKFDKTLEGKMPAGFEMLINNFSIGIFGMLLAIFGYYLIGPVMTGVLNFLIGAVALLVENSLLPFAAIFIEPAKVLFLNNAINHGIFTPIGIEQAAEAGKSIMYMLEANPGPGLGVLVAYWAFAKDRVTKSSAPGAIIIHFFGGIHEIYFPYILMNPILIIAPIVSSIVTIFYYTIFDAGLVGPASPGSIIAFTAVAPKGETLVVLGGVLLAAVVSFLVASPLVRMAGAKSLDDATSKMKDMKNESKGIAAAPVNVSGQVKKIVFACDAGMGSSAMGATKFRKRIEPLGLGITVINTSVDNVPADTDIVVCQQVLQERAKASAPQATLITIANFLADPALDQLFEQVKAQPTTVTATITAPLPAQPQVQPTEDTGAVSVMSPSGIILGLPTVGKEDAITHAGNLLHSLGYVSPEYIPAMLERERTVSTYMGLGVAIPHGTSDAKKEVQKSGIVFLQYPEGVWFGEEKAHLIFGIAGIGDEHLDLLAKIGGLIENPETLDKLMTATDVSEVFSLFD